MSNTKRLTAALLFSAPLFSSNAAAQQEKDRGLSFYDGPVRVSSVRGTIELVNGANPIARLETVLRNPAATTQTLVVGFRGASAERLTLGPGQSAHLTALTPLGRRSGSAGGSQSVGLDLALQINSLTLADPLDTVDVQILLPIGTAALIRSSMPATRDSSESRVSYRLLRRGLHLTMLTMVYAVGPVTLLIDKQLQPAAVDHAGPVTVTLTLRNVGSGDARDVSLEDSYDPRDFAAQGTGFQLVAGKENDRRLVWSGHVDRIPPGGVTTVTYNISALTPVANTSLAAATAVMHGQLVGVSNKIWLPPKRR